MAGLAGRDVDPSILAVIETAVGGDGDETVYYESGEYISNSETMYEQ